MIRSPKITWSANVAVAVEQCRDLLQTSGYAIEIDQPDTKEQPDGILVASK